MRINKYLAQSTNLSRRAADEAIASGHILVNGKPATIGQDIQSTDNVTFNGHKIQARTTHRTILLHKPVGYVCSRNGQGSKTIYSLLPKELQHLQPAGRLDKDSSGLLVMTDDGDLAHSLTHPSKQKDKVYEVTLDQELTPQDFTRITKHGVRLEDGLSKFALDYINDENFMWRATLHEGRNRQIRRTFEALGYKVLSLHRTKFDTYSLGHIKSGAIQQLDAR